MAEEGEDAAGNLAEERVQIIQLQSEQARKKELLERLKQKSTALKNEYEQRKVELEALQTDLGQQKRKQKEASKASEGITGVATTQATNLFMQQEAKEILSKRIPAMAEIEEEEDDGDQPPQMPRKDAGDDKGDKIHETVLVNYVNLGEKTEEFRVSYRIDKLTTVEQLHKDACAYWGCSNKEYSLRKIKDNKFLELPNEKPIIKVCGPEERSQLHLVKVEDTLRDQDLVKKLNLSLFSAPTPKADAESTEVKSVKRGRVEDHDNEEPFVSAFKSWPGIYWLLKSRYRRRASRHVRVIHMRDFLIYGLLALLSGLCIQYRGATMFYWLREGAMETLGKNVAEPHLPDFDSIVVYEDIWKWLEGPFQRQIFDNTSMLHEFYSPVGRLRLRQQKAMEIPCLRPKALLVVSQNCYAQTVELDNQHKEEQIIDSDLWITPTAAGRMALPNPLKYQAPEPTTRSLPGLMQSTYDSGGYMVDYEVLDPANPGNLTYAREAFLQDLPVFKKYWLARTTRIFVVELTLANYHMGGYVFCVFLVEVSASGAIQTSSIFTPFHIGQTTGDDMGDTLDYLRLLFVVVYCLCIKAHVEIKHKHGSNTSGLRYVFSFIGFLDMSVIAVFFTIFYARQSFVCSFPDPVSAFKSYSRDAFRFEQLRFAEAIFFCLVLLRLATLMRINARVFEYWKMFSRALRMYGYFLLLFGPIFMACVFISHAIWSPYFYSFSTWTECCVNLFIFIRGDLDVMELDRRVRVWTLIFVTYFYLAFTSFFMSGFLAIMAHAYFDVQLLYGKPIGSTKWSTEQWVDWACWGPVTSMVGMDVGACHRDPRRATEEDDDDDEDDSDEDDGDKKAD